MRYRLFIFCLLCRFFSFQLLFGQEEKVKDIGEIVVTANKLETPIEKTGKVIYKITAEDIRLKSGQSVAQLINGLPGINIEGVFGAPGTNLEYSIRGGRNRHTLVLINGLPINDPSLISSDYDLRLLNANQVESIEVMKGGAAALYGTNAAAGVINIQLKTAQTETPVINLRQSIGSFSTLESYADFSGKTGKLNYFLSGQYGQSDGISAATSNDPNVVFGNDGYVQKGFRTHLKYDFSERFDLTAQMALDDLEADFDGGAFSDANHKFNVQQWSVGLNPKWQFDRGKVELKFNYNTIDRSFESTFPSEHQGDNWQADLVHQFEWSDKTQLITGVQYQKFQFDNEGEEPQQLNVDPYLHLASDITEALTLNAGIRLNHNSEYGNNFLFNLNPSYYIPISDKHRLKFFGSYATAFVAPSLFQLYAGFFGNPNLEAETTRSVEMGSSLYLSDALTLNVAYFERVEENAIDFVSQFDNDGNYIGGSYANVAGERVISGIEIDAEWKMSDIFELKGHYANYKFGNPDQFFRIPDQKWGIALQAKLPAGTALYLSYDRFGERSAAIFSDPFLVDLEAYNMVQFNINQSFMKDKWQVSGSLENLLNEDFVGVYGFNTRPINFKLAVSVKF